MNIRHLMRRIDIHRIILYVDNSMELMTKDDEVIELMKSKND